MKSLATSMVYLLIGLSTLFATGIEFFHGTLSEAKQIAGQQGKLIFVDAFTTWCGPCKRMSANVFSQQDVGDFYNQSFINLKLDMEKGEGKEFQRQYQVNAFPTLLFLDPEGKVVQKVVGGMDVANFLQLGKSAASKSSVSSSLDKAYTDGQRDPAFMAQYIEALAKSNRPLLKIVNEYIYSQKDFGSGDNLKVLYYGLGEIDSRVFNLFVDHKKDIVKMFGEESVETQIVKAGKATVDKAIEFDNSDLLEEAVDKVKRYAQNEYKQFQYTSRLQFYGETRQPEIYLRYARDYVRQGRQYKFELVNKIFHEMRDQPELMKEATVWSVEIAEDEGNEENCFLAAQLLFVDGQYENSRSFADQALKLASAANSPTLPFIKKLVTDIEQKSGINKS
ncbi:MAG: thioredoxin family protein [Saprospiraceae bacterium]|nr:thioredoxin family protein [Saprospiraceae bacterium]